MASMVEPHTCPGYVLGSNSGRMGDKGAGYETGPTSLDAESPPNPYSR